MTGGADQSVCSRDRSARSACAGGRYAMELPTLSIVICTKDRPDPLARCVASVAAQTVRPGELIVVDDGTLSPADVGRVQTMSEGAGIRFVYKRKSPPNLPASRNLGVRLATGEIVQFLDDDVTLEPGFCEAVLRLYAADDSQVLAGTEGTLIEPGGDWARQAFEMLYAAAGWWALRPRGLRRPPTPACIRRGEAKEVWNIVGATMSFRRRLLLANPFDEALGGYALGEDRDMAYRLARCGWLVRAPDSRAIHHHEAAGRSDRFTFGRMTVTNYCRILQRSGIGGVGAALTVVYSFLVIGAAIAGLALLKPKRYWPEFKGMVVGAVQAIAAVV
jgi:glycosyltransferase involved in cell wall biosynthesis